MSVEEAWDVAMDRLGALREGTGAFTDGRDDTAEALAMVAQGTWLASEPRAVVDRLMERVPGIAESAAEDGALPVNYAFGLIVLGMLVGALGAEP